MPPRTATALFTILVTRNDFPPAFDSDLYSNNIQETVDVGSSILQVNATDQDIGVNNLTFFKFNIFRQCPISKSV